MNINQPYALNEPGQRSNNEDSIYPAKGEATVSNHFFLVCDGVGGSENGEVASQTVCESFAAYLKDVSPNDFSREVFERALAFAYDELDAKEQSSAHGNMGTTLTFLHLNNKEAFMAHIGDSRIYQLRPRGGKMEIVYQTSDHSLVNDLLKAGIITPEEALVHPKRNVITRAIQYRQEKRHKADVYQTSHVKAGDYFFLCSDGVTESISDSKLATILAANTGDREKIETIWQLCNEHSQDNFSAYLIPVGKGINHYYYRNLFTI